MSEITLRSLVESDDPWDTIDILIDEDPLAVGRLLQVAVNILKALDGV